MEFMMAGVRGQTFGAAVLMTSRSHPPGHHEARGAAHRSLPIVYLGATGHRNADCALGCRVHVNSTPPDIVAVLAKPAKQARGIVMDRHRRDSLPRVAPSTLALALAASVLQAGGAIFEAAAPAKSTVKPVQPLAAKATGGIVKAGEGASQNDDPNDSVFQNRRSSPPEDLPHAQNLVERDATAMPWRTLSNFSRRQKTAWCPMRRERPIMVSRTR